MKNAVLKKTIAKIWNHLKCTTTHDWNKNVVHIYNGVLFSHKEEQNVLCKKMDQIGSI
jgi:hypothetical protein